MGIGDDVFVLKSSLQQKSQLRDNQFQKLFLNNLFGNAELHSWRNSFAWGLKVTHYSHEFKQKIISLLLFHLDPA
jgi:hypothetical protein